MNLNESTLDVMRMIFKIEPKICFCGSIALNLYGVIDRPIHDIDIIIEDKYSKKLREEMEKYKIDRKFKTDEEGNESGGSKDYDLKYEHYTGKVNEINVDIFFAFFPVRIVGFKTDDKAYPLQNIEKIIEIKQIYYDRYGIEKHREDLNKYLSWKSK